MSKILYHYDIQYKPGKSNVVADASSRSHKPSVAKLVMLSIPQFLFIDDLRKELSLDGDYQARCQQIAVDPSITPEFSLSYGMLLNKGRIWIPPFSRFKVLLLKEVNETPIGGHAGVIKTLKCIYVNIYQPTIHKYIKVFLKEHVMCQ